MEFRDLLRYGRRMHKQSWLTVAAVVALCLLIPSPAAAIIVSSPPHPRNRPHSREAVRKTPPARPTNRGEVQRGIDTSITLLSLFTTRRGTAAPRDDGHPRELADAAAARGAGRAGSRRAVLVAARLIQSIPSHWGSRHLLI